MNVYKAQVFLIFLNKNKFFFKDFNLFAGNNVSQPQEIPQKNNNNNGSNLLDFENLDLNNDWKQSKNEKKNDDLLDF